MSKISVTRFPGNLECTLPVFNQEYILGAHHPPVTKGSPKNDRKKRKGKRKGERKKGKRDEKQKKRGKKGIRRKDKLKGKST